MTLSNSAVTSFFYTLNELLLSLVAIHRAVEAILSQTCEMAIAGGVNVMLTPTLTLSFSKAGMLSEDGRCKTFDKRANGYVRGEGVGAIWLKPLEKAQADGDLIYAVIKGTASNHGGHATSLTAPNPNAQTQLLISAYEQANIDPSTVSYIEAHGTGTSLGDPIEINGLKNAFAELYKKSGKSLPEKPHCGIGSVKTNIGHLETAAGIAGVLKVLLAMKHKTLPGLLHFSSLNPYIQLQGSPFFVVSENQTWTPLSENDGTKIPRRAGVSSFGFGGANAHLVLEEYNSKLPSLTSTSNQLIMLSAKNDKRLKAYAQQMIDFLEKAAELQLADLAYTLQVGRFAMEERLAMVVDSVDDLKDKLTQYANGQTESNDFYQSNVKTNKALTSLLVEGKAGNAFLKVVIKEKELNKLAQLWVSGVEIDWQLLYPNQKPQRISLPTYPFARERYWIPISKQTANNRPLTQSNASKSQILEKSWQKTLVPNDITLKLSGTIIVLVNEETLAMAHQLFQNEAVKTIIIQKASHYEKRSELDYAIEFNQATQGLQIAKDIFEKGETIVGVIDLSDLQTQPIVISTGSLAKITLLQALIKNHTPLHILHFTKGLQIFDTKQPTLAGADFAGLIKMLSAEYQKVQAKTIDIDDNANLNSIIHQEWQTLETEICYRNGKRYIPYLKTVFPLHSHQPGITINPEKVIVITGGTRGIGSAVAAHLVEKGARKLVLMGVQALPEREQWETVLQDTSTPPSFILTH